MSTWRPSGSPPSERDPRKVSEVLDRVTRRLGAPGSALLTQLFAGWEALVGADIAAHCRPVSVRDGVLHLVADQPAWASQLGFMAGDILARVAEATGSAEVTEIRVRVSGEDPPRSPRRRS